MVIPCYNHGKFIKETVQSVLEYTYSPIEVIIVNDGSDDDSEKVAMELTSQHSGFHYIKQKNSGPSVARNNGIRLSTGKYILPLDADDLISPDYIEKAVEILKKGDARIVYCEAEFFGERQGRWSLPPFSRRLLARENMIFCSALYHKEDWLRNGGYDERMTWGWEDWEFWISMLKGGGEVHKLPDVHFYYRVGKHSRRKSTNKEAKAKTVQLFNEKHREFLHEQLAGPLRVNRSMSRISNLFLKNVLFRNLN